MAKDRVCENTQCVSYDKDLCISPFYNLIEEPKNCPNCIRRRMTPAEFYDGLFEEGKDGEGSKDK